LAVSPEPELTIAQRSLQRQSWAGRARVRSELLAETNGSYTTSELSYFWRKYFSDLRPQPAIRSIFVLSFRAQRGICFLPTASLRPAKSRW